MAKREYRLAQKLHRLDVGIARNVCRNMQKTTVTADVTDANVRILHYLTEHEDQPVYQRDLERAFGITRSTASRVLQLMETKDLISRNGVSHDARLKQVTLTDRSRRFSDEAGKCAAVLEDKLLKGFTEREIRQLYQMLDRMIRNMD